MNKVFLVGRLATEPKQKITAKGLEQSNFNIAVTDMRNYENTYFFPCIAWGQTAKYINANFKKGLLVSIDGRLTKSSYINNEGRTIYSTEVCIENIRSLLPDKNSFTSNYAATVETINNNMVSSNLDKVVEIDEILKEFDNVSSNHSSEEKNQSQESNDEKKFDWEENI